MYRNFILTSAILFLALAAVAQDNCNSYFPLKKGSKWTTVIKGVASNLKGKEKEFTLKRDFEIENIEIEDGIVEAEIEIKMYGPNGNKVLSKYKQYFYCFNGTYMISLIEYLGGYQQLREKKRIEMAENGANIPANLEEFPELEDVSAKIQSKDFITRLTTSETIIELKERKVEGKENISTEMGELEAFKISSKSYIEMGKLKKKGKVLEYIVPKYGMVRRSAFDENDRLISQEDITYFRE